MTLNARAHQVPVIETSVAAFMSGIRRQILNLATGAGKTVCAALIAQKLVEWSTSTLGQPFTILVLAHREELLEQMAKTLVRALPPDYAVTTMGGGLNPDVRARVVVASTATAVKRIGWIKAWAEMHHAALPVEWRSFPRFIIVDECHHYAADTFGSVLDAFPESFLLGLTATLERMDGRGLQEHFDDVVARLSIVDGIRDGWLCNLKGRQIRLEQLDLAKVKSRKGDFVERELEQAINIDTISDEVVRHWRRFAHDRQTMVFAVNVAHAYALAEAFTRVGVAVMAADGSLSRSQRKAVVNRYRAGTIQVLVNCQLWTEGFDAPSTSCVMMVRPTQSRALYSQVIGRGSRIAPEKRDCLILDFVGATARHDVVTLGTLFGEFADAKPKRPEELHVPSKDERQLAKDAGIIDIPDLYADDDSVISIEDRLVRSRPDATTTEFDITAPGARAQLQWGSFTKEGTTNKVWVLPLGPYGRVTVEPVGDEMHTVVRRGRAEADQQVLLSKVGFDEAFGWAEELALGVAAGRVPDGWTLQDGDNPHAARHMLDQNAKWRTQPPTDGQIKLLKRYKLWRDGILRGEASTLIEAEHAKRDGTSASAKQIAMLRQLRIDYKPGLSASEASRLIGRAMAERKTGLADRRG